jgi:hypothetical protein
VKQQRKENKKKGTRIDSVLNTTRSSSFDLGLDHLQDHLDQLLETCTHTKPTQYYAKWQCHLAG